MGVDESRTDPIMRQSVFQQIITASVNCLLRYDMSAVLCQRLYRICDRRRTGSQRQSRRTTFQRRDSPFQDILCRICQTTVDVARILPVKRAAA